MIRWLIWAALGVLLTGSASRLSAQSTTTPALPAWPDQASVYLTMSQQAPANDEAAVDSAAAEVATSPPATLVPDTAAIEPVSSVENRHLAPPSTDWNVAAKSIEQNQATPTTDSDLRSFALPRDTIYKIGSALAIVVGLFLVFAWLLRRGARNMDKPLPADVVSVLGRAPLANRHFADLLRVGNKLVLVALSPAGPTTITEVTDPVEVDRLVGLCQQSDPHSTTRAFEQVFRQLARDPAPTGFLGGEAPPAALAPAFDSFRVPRGEVLRA
jgi:flagellar biogenesis protein FliO